MKNANKWIAGLLCLALCLGLAACGGGNGGGTNGDYDRLIEMLENKDFSGAVNYINQLAYQEAEKNKGDKPTESVHAAYLYGTWEERNVPDKETPSPTVTFKQDGTCSVGETSYLWEVMNDETNYLSVNILDGATKVYSFSLSKDNTGHYAGSPFDYTQEENAGKSLGSYINYAHYEAVELTVDNWSQYFCEEEYENYSTNSFNEVTGLTLYRRYRLKDEYRARLYTPVTSVAMEYSYISGSYEGTFDLTAKTYTLGEFKPNTDSNGQPKRSSSTDKLGSYSGADGTSYYGYACMSSTGYSRSSDGSQYFSNYKTDMKIERVQGTLYLLKEAE